jgi:ATP-binding cassette subfamily B protein
MKRIKAFIWSFKTAWKISRSSMLLWFGLAALLAVLPAVALRFNRYTLTVISGFLSGTGGYTYSDVVPPIIALGALMTVIGLSARVNVDLIYIMMYDAYFSGMYVLTMENIQRMKMTDLLKKEIGDEWHYCVHYAGSLVAFTSGLCAVASKAVALIALLVVAFGVSKIIFAIAAVYVAGVFILNFAFTKKTRYQREVDFKESRQIEYYERVSDTPGMAKETRVYENTDEIAAHWAKPYGRRFDAEAGRIRAGAVRDFIGGAGFYIFLIIAVGISLFGVARGSMTPDVFLVLFTLCLNIYTTVSGAAGLIVNFDSGLYGLDRQRAFFERMPMTAPEDERDKYDSPADEDTVFRINDLCFSYSEDAPVLRDVSFTIKRGEVVALVGENGSGKSTLVKLLLNMYRPTAGTVELLGRPYRDYRRDFTRGRIGVFFQDFWLFHQTLRENIGVGGIEDIGEDGKIWDAARKGGAEKLAKRLPGGLETLLKKFMDKSGTELSGGEQQRVAGARAHMNNRDILIFDEPASMLDPIAEMEQFMGIKNMLDGRTAILISHRVGFARMADRIIMLHNGMVAETGGHDELMDQGGLYARFFNEQAQWYETTGARDGGEGEAL